MVRYGTVGYGTVRCGAVRYGAVRCGTVWYGTAQCSAVQRSAVRYGMVWCGVVRYGTVQRSAVQYLFLAKLRFSCKRTALHISLNISKWFYWFYWSSLKFTLGKPIAARCIQTPRCMGLHYWYRSPGTSRQREIHNQAEWEVQWPWPCVQQWRTDQLWHIPDGMEQTLLPRSYRCWRIRGHTFLLWPLWTSKRCCLFVHQCLVSSRDSLHTVSHRVARTMKYTKTLASLDTKSKDQKIWNSRSWTWFWTNRYRMAQLQIIYLHSMGFRMRKETAISGWMNRQFHGERVMMLEVWYMTHREYRSEARHMRRSMKRNLIPPWSIWLISEHVWLAYGGQGC